MNKYYVQLFDGLTPARDAKSYYKRATIDAARLFYLETPDENIWNNAPHEFEIFANKDGIGFRTLHPAGYSSYTYEPETEERFYNGATWEWFKLHALDQDQRDMISADAEDMIKNGLTEEQKR